MPSESQKKLAQAWIPAKLHETLERIARAKDVSLAHCVRRALELYAADNMKLANRGRT